MKLRRGCFVIGAEAIAHLTALSIFFPLREDLLENSHSMQRCSSHFLHQMQSPQQRSHNNVEWWHANREGMQISHGKLENSHARSHGDLDSHSVLSFPCL